MRITAPYCETVRRNLDIVQERINAAARRAGRSPNDIRLLVVTKTQPIEVIQCVIDEGAVHLGENYVEEAREKILALQNNKHCSWHMIGHVQSRKSSEVVRLFDYVHSLDSLRLAQRLNLNAVNQGKILSVMLEFNLSGEESKSGWRLGMEPEWNVLLSDIEAILNLSNLSVCGLMTIPPFNENPEEARHYFNKLSQLKDLFQNQFPKTDWRELSMGMSNDYEIAIEEGATWVRIGQAILGHRLA